MSTVQIPSKRVSRPAARIDRPHTRPAAGNKRAGKPKRVVGVVKNSPAAVRLQRIIAFLVVAAPIVGVVIAGVQIALYGVALWQLAVLGVMYVVSVLGVSVGYHRHFAHRSFKAQTWVRYIFGAMGSMASQGPLLFSVAQHPPHPVYSDQECDPHSPQLHGGGIRGMAAGLWHAHIGWMFSEETADWIHFARDTMRDRQAWLVHRQYFFWMTAGLVLPALVGLACTGSLLGLATGFLWGGLVRMFAVNQASWCVGSICHAFGSRPFRNQDHSANNFWVALFTFGEGLQTTPHAFPSSAAHALRWYEPDFSILAIRVLERIGLLWEVNTPSERAITKAKGGVHIAPASENLPPESDDAGAASTANES